MSRYSYHGRFQNPADNYFVKAVADHFEIWVRSDRNSDGSAPKDRKAKFRGGNRFDEHEDAAEAIASIAVSCEEDYDAYCEENHDALVWEDRYEAYKREF